MSVNRVILSGAVSSYGPKISWTDGGKPQCTFTLVCEEPGRDGRQFKTFIPVCVVGSQAEAVAEQLDADDVVLIDGRLSWKAGQTKDTGKLQVVCFEVEWLTKAPAVAETAGSGEGEAHDTRRGATHG